MALVVPPVMVGCGTFGGIGGARQLIGMGLDETAAGETMDEAARLGLLWWDTAERYAGGASETMIGAWLSKQPPELADRIQIATKVAPPTLDGPAGRRFDRKYIESKIELSLARLQRREVALYLSHSPCEITPVDEVLEGFAAVVESGRARRIGCCNVDAAGLSAAVAAADRLGVRGFEWVQNSYSLLDPNADRDVRAICRERGIGYSPYSPLAGGILTGKYRRGEAFPPDSRMALRPDDRLLTERTHDALDVLRLVAADRGVSCAAVALAWMLGHADCRAPVIGPSRSGPHLLHVSEALAIELNDDERARIEHAFAAAIGR